MQVKHPFIGCCPCLEVKAMSRVRIPYDDHDVARRAYVRS